MKAIAAVLFVALMAAGLARANVPGVERRSVQANCDPTECIVARSDLEALARGNQALAEMVEAQQAELRKLRDLKGCGKLEVVPPAKPTRPTSAPEARRT